MVQIVTFSVYLVTMRAVIVTASETIHIPTCDNRTSATRNEMQQLSA